MEQVSLSHLPSPDEGTCSSENPNSTFRGLMSYRSHRGKAHDLRSEGSLRNHKVSLDLLLKASNTFYENIHRTGMCSNISVLTVKISRTLSLRTLTDFRALLLTEDKTVWTDGPT